MNLEELKVELGAKATEYIAKYGPSIVNVAQATARQWVDYVFVGRYLDAYVLYLKAVSNDEILTEWSKEGANWKADNQRNAESLEMSNAIAKAVCNDLLILMLALAGF